MSSLWGTRKGLGGARSELWYFWEKPSSVVKLITPAYRLTENEGRKILRLADPRPIPELLHPG